MKHPLLIILFSISIMQISAQSVQTNQEFTFKKLDFSFKAPTGFELVDSSTHTISPNPEIVIWRQQFVFKSSDAGMSLSVSTSTQKGIDWENVYKKEAKQYFDQMRIRKPGVKFDSSSTLETIDSQIFNKFIVLSKENGKMGNNHVQLSKYYKGYKINISYNYIRPETREEIERFIKSIKLSK